MISKSRFLASHGSIDTAIGSLVLRSLTFKWHGEHCRGSSKQRNSGVCTSRQESSVMWWVSTSKKSKGCEQRVMSWCHQTQFHRYTLQHTLWEPKLSLRSCTWTFPGQCCDTLFATSVTIRSSTNLQYLVFFEVLLRKHTLSHLRDAIDETHKDVVVVRLRHILQNWQHSNAQNCDL